MSEVEGEEGENNAERERDISAALEADDIVEKKGNTASVVWQWFGYGKSDNEQTKVCRRRSAKYASGWYQPRREIQRISSIT